MDAARSDVSWLAVCGAQNSEAEVCLSDVSRVDVKCKGTLGGQMSVSSAGVSRKKRKSSDTERVCGDAGLRVLPGHRSR